MVYANEAFYALLQGVLVNVIVNQNNTRPTSQMWCATTPIVASPFIANYCSGQPCIHNRHLPSQENREEMHVCLIVRVRGYICRLGLLQKYYSSIAIAILHHCCSKFFKSDIVAQLLQSYIHHCCGEPRKLLS